MSALVRARGQIMFLMGLVLASGVVFWLNGLESVPASDIEPASALVYTPPAQVQAAWYWFEQNTDPTTGLVESNASSAADSGHLLKALIAAHRLGLINGRELYQRVDRALETLSTTPLPADDAQLISALELLAWSYPANSGKAAAVLEKVRASGVRAGAQSAVSHTTTPGSGGRAQTSVAVRHAEVLVAAAIQRRGDD